MTTAPRRNPRRTPPTTAAEVLWSIASDENMPPNVRCRAAEALLAHERAGQSSAPSAADTAERHLNALNERTRELVELAARRGLN